MRQAVAHRRGLSLDTRRQHFSQSVATPTFGQDYMTVGTPNTNSGMASTPQHVMRESQQQQHMARPGPSYLHSSDDFLNSSPLGTPQHQHFMDAMAAQAQIPDMSGMQMDNYLASMNLMMKKNQPSYSNNSINTGQDFEFFGPDSSLSTPTFMTFPDSSPAGSGAGWISEGETASTHTRRTSRRISNGILDKVAKFEAMHNTIDGTGQRPATPPTQNTTGNGPPQTLHLATA